MMGICLQIFDFFHKEIFKSVSKRIILPYKVSENKQWAQPYCGHTHCPNKNKQIKRITTIS